MKYLCLCFMMFCSALLAQKNIPFRVQWQRQSIDSLPATIQFQHTAWQLQQVKLYISHVQAYSDNTMHHATKEFYLFDVGSDRQHMTFANLNKVDSLCFTIGIDSVTSSSGVMGEDLDPTTGMYWTWQSGYINFKLEASKEKEKLEYHLGGFSYPYNCSRRVCLQSSAQNPQLIFHADVWLSKIPRECPKKIMSPGVMAMRLSDLLTTSFTLQ